MEPIFKRDEKGRLRINSALELTCYIGALFEHCKTHIEVDWLHEVLEAYIEDAREGMHGDLERNGLPYEEEDEDDE